MFASTRVKQSLVQTSANQPVSYIIYDIFRTWFKLSFADVIANFIVGHKAGRKQANDISFLRHATNKARENHIDSIDSTSLEHVFGSVENSMKLRTWHAVGQILVGTDDFSILDARCCLSDFAADSDSFVSDTRLVILMQFVQISLDDVSVISTSQPLVACCHNQQARFDRPLHKPTVIIGRALLRQVRQQFACCRCIGLRAFSRLLSAAHLASCHHLHSFGDLPSVLDRTNTRFKLLSRRHLVSPQIL